MRTAFSSIALNTGSKWPGELLITFRISEVAVCCSSASFSLCSSSAIFSSAVGGLRPTFGALRRFNVLRRCVSAALPPTLSRGLIASPEAQDKASYWLNLARRKGVATRAIQPPNVRFGSKADMCSAKGHVRFAPESAECVHSNVR